LLKNEGRLDQGGLRFLPEQTGEWVLVSGWLLSIPASHAEARGRFLERVSERRWVTALAKPKRAARVAKMSEVQFSEAQIEKVSEPSVGEA
jgi:hypothetical protein